MTEVFLLRHHGIFLPADQLSADAINELGGNGPYRAQLTKPRNLAFLRKFFALIRVGFESWEQHQDERASMDRFRKDLLVLAGYYDTRIAIDGSIHLEPKSISFAAMDETEFEQVYNDCVNVLLERVMILHSRKDIDRQVETIMGFA